MTINARTDTTCNSADTKNTKGLPSPMSALEFNGTNKIPAIGIHGYSFTLTINLLLQSTCR